MGPSSLCPQTWALLTPPPPNFFSAHDTDHIFVFSFSIFRYPRVLRKAQAGGEPRTQLPWTLLQSSGVVPCAEWPGLRKTTGRLGPNASGGGKHKGSFLCPGPVLVLVLGNKVSCGNLAGMRGWPWVGQKECSSGPQPEACSAWNGLVPGWTGQEP